MKLVPNRRNWFIEVPGHRILVFLVATLGPLFFNAFNAFNAHAYEILPEYRTVESHKPFGALSQGKSYTRIDGEYQSDFLTYTERPEDEWIWFSQGNQMQGSVGSLSSKTFLNRHRLRLEAPLIENFEFKFIFFEDKDFESNSQHIIFEFSYWFNDRHGLAWYMEPASEKEEMDTGVAYLLRPQKNKEWRVFFARPDFQRNKRRKGSDEFNKDPIAYGLTYKSFQDNGGFLNLYARDEINVDWCFPDEEFCFEYNKTVLGGFYRHTLAPERFLSLRGEWSYTRTLRRAEASSSRSSYNQKRERYLLDMRYATPRIGMGLGLSRRDWQSLDIEPSPLNPGRVKQMVYQPYVYRVFTTRSPQRFWELGYEFSTADRRGQLEDLEGSPSRTDHRLNVTKLIRFPGAQSQRESAQNELRLVFTFDLGRLASEPWEGGNVRLRLDI